MTANKPLSLLWIALFVSSVFVSKGQIMVPPPAPDHYNTGVDLLQNGKYEAAIREFDMAISLNKHEIDAYYNRGIAKFKMLDTLHACRDWCAVALFGDTTAYSLINRYCNGLIITNKDTVTLDQLRLPDTSKVYTFVDEMPEFRGGQPALIKYTAEHIKYPVNAKHNNKQGRVYVSMIINKFGEVINPEIIRVLDHELDTEALRVVKLMPRWIPGKLNGIPVNVQCTLPITFSLL